MAWGKSLYNPILQNPSGLVGFGYGTLFKEKEGVLRYASHAHHDGAYIHPRLMYITTATYDHEVNLRLSEDDIVPKFKQ